MRPSPSELISAGNRAAGWVSNRLAADGSFPGVENEIDAYYKMPVLFALSDRPSQAQAIEMHLRKRFFEDGDFHANTPAEVLSFRNYRNGWIARGLQMLGSTQMATAAGDYLEGEMVQSFGAVVTEPWKPGVKVMDWGTTCSAAKAFLCLGRNEAAIRCGEYLLETLANQPLAERFLLKRDLNGDYLRDDDPTFVIEIGGTDQIYFPLGFGMLVFADLYALTGDGKWLTAAEKLYDTVMKCNDEIYSVITNRKAAWGAAQLYSVTGDAKYAQLSLHIWQWTMDTQTPEGLWLRHPEYSSLEEQPLEFTVDAAVESGLYMFELARSLSGYLVKDQ